MWSVNAPTALSRCYATGKRNFFCSLSRHQSTYCFILNRVTKMKNPVALPVSQAREGRKTSALENYLIRFFERELEVKLTRREMWRSVSFFARSLAFLEKNPHLCNALHLIRARRLANSYAASIFCACRSIYSSVPCGALMRPLPLLGVTQRGAELFYSLPVFWLTYCFILNAL